MFTVRFYHTILWFTEFSYLSPSLWLLVTTTMDRDYTCFYLVKHTLLYERALSSHHHHNQKLPAVTGKQLNVYIKNASQKLLLIAPGCCKNREDRSYLCS